LAYIEIKNILKTYPLREDHTKSKQVIIDSLSLSIDKGEFVTIFGPNGCGKSTLLHIIAGLIDFDSGVVSINGKTSSESMIGYVFQDYRDSLLPWRYTIDNIAFPLELQRMEKSKRINKARELLRRFKIEIPEYAYPYQLSSGQAQLVAITRALISEPDVLLMDEPFNQLDLQTRIFIQDKLLDIWRETGITIIFISHDLDEAVLLGGRIVMLSKKPSNIVKIIVNSLPVERTHNIITNDEFFKYKTEIIKTFEEIIK
jgi:NitT/TauT family transport system ATP-binding protein